jgi:hypothetical protein
MIDMLSYFADEMVLATLQAGQTGSYVNGVWTPSFATGVSISIVFPQPVSQDLLQQLPQGERAQNYVQTWTTADVNVRDDTTDSDRIVYAGKTYLVYQSEDRTFPGNFRHLILREITADE